MSKKYDGWRSPTRRVKKNDVYYGGTCPSLSCRCEFFLDQTEFLDCKIQGHCSCPVCGAQVAIEHINRFIEVDMPIFKH